MDLALTRVLLDFGLFVLILLVQLVIYPSFTHMSVSDLKKWHPSYTKRITVVVLPLMVGQAVVVLLQVIQEFSYLNLTSLLVVIALWLLTFLQAVPLHRQIVDSEKPLAAAKKLVAANRIRVFFWGLLFIFSGSSCL